MTDTATVTLQPVAVAVATTAAGPVAVVARAQVAVLVAAAAQGAAGRDGLGGTPYEHRQAQAQNVWTVNHNLGYRPLVSVLTLSGLEQLAQVQHASVNLLYVISDDPFTGFAICK